MEGSTYLRQAGKRERERAQSGRRPPLIVYIYVQESRVIDDVRRARSRVGVHAGHDRTGDPRQCDASERKRETRRDDPEECKHGLVLHMYTHEG